MKAVVSVIGIDKKGIIAKVSGALYDMDINIEDISQTIMQDYFTMIMMIDFSDSISIGEIKNSLDKVAESLHLEINVRHEEIYRHMHRI